MHDADLRKARKLHLLPSVTTVLNVWPKFVLDNYKLESAILSALTLPQLPNEPIDKFAARVVEDSRAKMVKAGEFGKRLHKICEEVNTNGGTIDAEKVPHDLHNHVAAYCNWFSQQIEHVFSAESVAVDLKHGYAGQYDLACRRKGRPFGVLVDMKTQDFKGKKTPNIYDTWEMQLSAYSHTINAHLPGLIEEHVSIVFNSGYTGQPGEPIMHVYDWDSENSPVAFRKFLSCLNLWRESKNYYYDQNAPAPIFVPKQPSQ